MLFRVVTVLRYRFIQLGSGWFRTSFAQKFFSPNAGGQKNFRTKRLTTCSCCKIDPSVNSSYLKYSVIDYVCQVTLPSGYRVTVNRNYWGIDVHIQAPQIGTHDGLCGNFNNRKDDDNHAADGNNFR